MFNFFRRKKDPEKQAPQPAPAPVAAPAPQPQAAPVQQPVQAAPVVAPTPPPVTPVETRPEFVAPQPQAVAPVAPVQTAPAFVPAASVQPAPAPTTVKPVPPVVSRPLTPEELMDDHYQQPQEIQQQTNAALEKSRGGIFSRIGQLFEVDDITDEFWDDLTDLLLQADVGYNLTEKLIENMQRRTLDENIKRGRQVEQIFREEMVKALRDAQSRAIKYVTDQQLKQQQQRDWEQRQRDKKNKNQPQPVQQATVTNATSADGSKRPYVMLIVGVNGNGKTTSIAKLSHYYKEAGASIVLGAADTFRAGAINQIKTWGERVGVPVIARQQGADPASVAFDTVRYAQENNCDLVIMDTAGRMQTNSGLMEEMKKIERTIERAQPGAPDEVLLVLDAVTGQNGLSQAKEFSKLLGVDGIMLTKLDGTARGGVAFAIVNELKIPIKYIGTGEKPTDFAEFDPEAYVNALFRK